MEATLIIKLPDGTEKTIELKNVSINTIWSNGGFAPIITPQDTILVGNLTVQGQIKDNSLAGSV